MLVLIVLAGYLVASGACTLATGAALDPVAFAAAVLPLAPPVLEELRDFAVDGSIGLLLHLHNLHLNLQMLDSSHAARHAGSGDVHGAPQPRLPRDRMRRFRENITWESVCTRYNDYEFRMAHGVDLPTFHHLLDDIRPHIEDDDRGHGGQRNGHRVSPEIKLHMTLRWLRGGQYHDAMLGLGVSRSCFFTTVWKVIDAINRTHSLPMAEAVAAARRNDTSALRRWAEGFSKYTHGIISHCFGAIDGVQILLKKPRKSEAPAPKCFFNRYGKPTLNLQVRAALASPRLASLPLTPSPTSRVSPLQVISDSFSRVLWMSTSAPGGMHDHQALNVSSLRDPLVSVLAPLGFYLVGDEAYVNGLGILSPVNSPNHGSPEEAFNYYQSLTRNPIERTFGMMERRWGILGRRLEVSLHRVAPLLLAIVHLHNLCMERVVPEVPAVAPGMQRSSDGATYAGRRYDLEGSSLRASLVAALAACGFQRPAREV